MKSLKEWFSAKEIAGLPGELSTSQGVNRKYQALPASLRRSRQGNGGGWEFHLSAFPPQTQTALLLQQNTPESKAADTDHREAQLWEYYEAKPQKTKDEAARRVKILRTVTTLTTNGISVGNAINIIAKQSGVATSTIRNWRKAVKGADTSDWLPLLVPKHTGRQKEASCSGKAWEWFKADYLRLEAPAAAACYERLQRTAKQNGWKVPSLRTLFRKIEKEIPRPALILAREGEEALKRSFPAQVRDHAFYHALEAVNADGHKFDVFVRWPGGEICRPVGVFWQDIYSGKILSHRLDKTENTDSIRLSFGDVTKRYGIPKHAFLDNGRGFAGKFISGGASNRYRFKVKKEEPAGIMTIMGVEIHWTTPYHGQAKPTERAFRDLCEYVAKHPRFAGAYTGNTPNAKPENYGSNAIPLDEFQKVLDQEIIAHNTRKGRRSPVCAGKYSFDEVFNRSYAKSRIRKATESQLRLCLLAAEKVRSSKQDGSITLLTNRYYSDILANCAGQSLVVRFDPQNLHAGVHAYRLDGCYIGMAECVQAAGFGDTTAAREHNRLRNQYKKAAKQQLARERTMTAIEASKMLPAPEAAEETPENKVTELFFEQSKTIDVTEDREEAFGRAVNILKKQNNKSLLG